MIISRNRLFEQQTRLNMQQYNKKETLMKIQISKSKKTKQNKKKKQIQKQKQSNVYIQGGAVEAIVNLFKSVQVINPKLLLPY